MEWETPGLRTLAPLREGHSGQKGELGHPGEPGTPKDLGQDDCRAEKGEEGVQRVVPPCPQTPGSAGKQWDGDGGAVFDCQPRLPSLLFTELLAAKKTHTCE